MKNCIKIIGFAAALAAGAAQAAEKKPYDFDFGNNKEFLRKYPDLACIDQGPMPREEADKYSAKLIRDISRKEAIEVTRPACVSSEGHEASGKITETISGAEYLDRLYARLSSGPIPHGFYDGTVILSRDRGMKSVSELGVWMPKEKNVEFVADRIWAGKFFDRERMYLKNRINLDGIDWASAPQSLTDKRMKFPAKIYCGQSLFDSRRESIVIDYMFGVQDRPEGIDTDEAIDWLAGAQAFQIRDEIRMVKPGLYLGRAYLKLAFGLYFVLEYHEGTGVKLTWEDKDACWLGHQRQKVLGMRPSDYINNAAN